MQRAIQTTFILAGIIAVTLVAIMPIPEVTL